MTSIYELLNPLGTVAGQSIVSRFTGDSLESRWNYTDIVGTGSGAMEDAVNEGYQITTGATDDDESGINFNDIRPFSNTSSFMIASVKRDATARLRVGFSENTDMSNSFVLIENDFDDTNYQIVSDDGTTESTTNGLTSVDTSWHTHKLRVFSTSLTLHIDGSFEAVKTSNLPDFRQQPFFSVKARSAGAKTGNIRYLEAVNI